jgi:hypothetical protein
VRSINPPIVTAPFSADVRKSNISAPADEVNFPTAKGEMPQGANGIGSDCREASGMRSGDGEEKPGAGLNFNFDAFTLD